MLKISNYSLNYAKFLAGGQMSILDFLTLCRRLAIEGASLHVQNLPNLSTDYLKTVRRAYLDHGLSMAMFTVSTDFGRREEARELEKAREAIRAAMFLGAPLLRVFAGPPPSEAERGKAFDRAVSRIHKVYEEAALAGMPIGLQNHSGRATVSGHVGGRRGTAHSNKASLPCFIHKNPTVVER